MSVKNLGHSIMGTPLGIGLGELAHAGGRIFYVDSELGDDGNTGLEPDKAKKTVNAAYVACTTNKNDVIALIPRATSYAISASESILTWSKDYVHMVGASDGRVRVDMAAGVSTAGIALSGDGCVFKNVYLTNSSNTAASGALVLTGTNCTFVNCQIAAMLGATSAADAGAYTIKFTGGGGHKFIGCTIGQTSQARTNANSDIIPATSVDNVSFTDCKFIMNSGSAAQFFLSAGASSITGVWVFRSPIFANVGTGLTTAFSINAAPGGYFVLDTGALSFGSTKYCASANVLIGAPVPTGLTSGLAVAAA